MTKKKRKKLSFFLVTFFGRVLVFLFSYFLVFFYKFPPQMIWGFFFDIAPCTHILYTVKERRIVFYLWSLKWFTAVNVSGLFLVLSWGRNCKSVRPDTSWISVRWGGKSGYSLDDEVQKADIRRMRCKKFYYHRISEWRMNIKISASDKSLAVS